MTANMDKLLGMGLTPTDLADEALRFSNWPRKTSLHTSVKNSHTHLASCTSLWRTNAATPALNQVCCRIPIHIAKVSAVVTAGATDGVADKNLPEKFYLCTEETATWTKQYIKYATESDNNKANLKSTVSENL